MKKKEILKTDEVKFGDITFQVIPFEWPEPIFMEAQPLDHMDKCECNQKTAQGFFKKAAELGFKDITGHFVDPSTSPGICFLKDYTTPGFSYYGKASTVGDTGKNHTPEQFLARMEATARLWIKEGRIKPPDPPDLVTSLKQRIASSKPKVKQGPSIKDRINAFKTKHHEQAGQNDPF